MHAIPQDIISDEFVTVWKCAGMHIQKMGQEGVHWIRASLYQPMAEHLSFRLGNQLFFVFVESVASPFSEGAKKLFMHICDQARATPCLLPMKRGGQAYEPAILGWGFIHAVTGAPVDPFEMVSDALIEMSDWELHDFAVQIVCDHLEKQGNSLMSRQSDLMIDPSLWFADKSGPHWVVVRAVRYPSARAMLPANIEAIKQSCAVKSKSGFFASVAVASDKNQASDKTVPLYRGHGMIVSFRGLEPV